MAFYLIDKEEKNSSAKEVSKLKQKLKVKKAGHCGTLDPFASGLLIIATDGDTKFLSKFLSADKSYEGEILFGISTDSFDITGKIVNYSSSVVKYKKLKKLISDKFIGEIRQMPPIFSAKKVSGKPAYWYARKKQTVSLKKQNCYIYDFKIKQLDINHFYFRVRVSSGTYIRSLINDLGIKIGVPAVLFSLRRTQIANIKIEDSKKISQNLIPYDAFDLLKIEKIVISYPEMKHLLEGKNLIMSNLIDSEVIFICDLFQVWAKKTTTNTYQIFKRIS